MWTAIFLALLGMTVLGGLYSVGSGVRAIRWPTPTTRQRNRMLRQLHKDGVVLEDDDTTAEAVDQLLQSLYRHQAAERLLSGAWLCVISGAALIVTWSVGPELVMRSSLAPGLILTSAVALAGVLNLASRLIADLVFMDARDHNPLSWRARVQLPRVTGHGWMFPFEVMTVVLVWLAALLGSLTPGATLTLDPQTLVVGSPWLLWIAPVAMALLVVDPVLRLRLALRRPTLALTADDALNRRADAMLRKLWLPETDALTMLLIPYAAGLQALLLFHVDSAVTSISAATFITIIAALVSFGTYIVFMMFTSGSNVTRRLLDEAVARASEVVLR